ncbi:MAG: HAD family hydrolase [Phycisphaerae bacterium]
MVKAVVFDLDDTLFAERDYVLSGYRAIGEHLRRRLGRTEPFEDWLWDRFLAGRAKGAFNALAEHYALGLPAGIVDELVRAYREHEPAIEPYGGIPDLLGRLRNGMAVGLLSDGFQPGQRLKLAALKLERFFDAVVFTEDIGRQAWKPSPAGFEAIRDKLGVEHAACAYVADNPAKDFLAGNQLGWRTIQYLHPLQIHAANPAPEGGGPQAVVRDPQELWQALLA